MTGKNSQNKNKGGRPTVITPDIVANLENSLRQGFTVSKACEIAKIGRDAYYDRLKKNKKFADRMESALKFLEEKARQNVGMAIENDDVQTSKWYLERKVKGEFGIRTELTGKDGEPLHTNDVEEIRSIANDLKKLLTPADEPTTGNETTTSKGDSQETG